MDVSHGISHFGMQGWMCGFPHKACAFLYLACHLEICAPDALVTSVDFIEPLATLSGLLLFS